MSRKKWIILSIPVLVIAALVAANEITDWEYSTSRLKGLGEPEVRQLLGPPYFDTRSDSRIISPDGGYTFIYLEGEVHVVFGKDRKVLGTAWRPAYANAP